jgi:hypothetical protein
MTHRLTAALATVSVLAAVATAAPVTFISTWKSPSAGPLNFAGRKVAALVIVDDLNLQMSAEEALAREITARGPVGVAAYRLIPHEELVDRDRAKTWFEKAGIQGVVSLRLVATDTQKVYSAVVWSSGYYANAWDYYGYGWATPYPIGKGRDERTITVETMLFDLTTANPIWAGVSRTTDPKDAASFMKELAREVVKNLEKEGLARK